MPRRPITVEDLWAIPRVGSPVPSSDGAFAVVPVTTYSMETNEGATRLWLVPAGGEPPRALTSTDSSSSQPAVSPDGARIAFVRKPGGAKPAGKGRRGPSFPDQPQIYVLPVGGGEPERMTDLPLGVADPRWFPDGRRLAFLAPVRTSAPTIEGTTEFVKSAETEPAKPFVTEDRVYRFWDRWLTDGKVHHLVVLDTVSRELVDLTPSLTRWFPLMDPSDHYRIAPDGREIAFSACRSDPPFDPVVWGVWTVRVPESIAAGAALVPPSLVTSDHPADAERPIYSPDGRYLVYGIQREIDFYGDKTRLVALDRSSGRHTVLTEAWDRSAQGWSFGDDSRTVFLMTETEGRSAILSLDLEAALADPDRNPPRELVRGGTFTPPMPAGGRIFTTLQSLAEPPEAVSYSADGTGFRRLTQFTAPEARSQGDGHQAGIDLGRTEETVFGGAGGRAVQMFLVHPPESAAAPTRGARPLVQVIHGGPHAASADQWHWRWNAQLFAAPGYLVAMVNFHGSTGWGQEFTASILGRWGDQPYQDVMAATDVLIERGLADPARMAAAGGSYGGYLASWIASQTDRFACIVNHAGVCDLQTQFGSDISQGRRRAIGGSPWENADAMDRWNPMRHARGFRSPMLVIHGERDYRVPYIQGLEIYNVYKAMKLPARLVCYTDENHWVLKPANGRHWYGEVHAWLARWLGRGAEKS